MSVLSISKTYPGELKRIQLLSRGKCSRCSEINGRPSSVLAAALPHNEQIRGRNAESGTNDFLTTGPTRKKIFRTRGLHKRGLMRVSGSLADLGEERNPFQDAALAVGICCPSLGTYFSRLSLQQFGNVISTGWGFPPGYAQTIYTHLPAL